MQPRLFSRIGPLPKYQDVDTTAPLSKWQTLSADQEPTITELLAEAQDKYIDDKRARQIERNFGQKVRLLVDRGYLEPTLGACLDRLHEYRNEAYHKGHVRVGNLQQAVRIYFEIDCTLLADLHNPAPSLTRIWTPSELTETQPTVAKYVERSPIGQANTGATMPRVVAEQLALSGQLDLRGLREDSVHYLHSQIGEMESEIDFCLTAGGSYPDGWKRTDVVRCAFMARELAKGRATP